MTPNKITNEIIQFVEYYYYRNTIYRNAVTVQCRNMRNRIFRNKEYSLLEQVPISVADFNALAARNYEGTE